MSTLNRSLGMVLLAIWLILSGLVSLFTAITIPYYPQIMGILALAAGILILLRR